MLFANKARQCAHGLAVAFLIAVLASCGGGGGHPPLGQNLAVETLDRPQTAQAPASAFMVGKATLDEPIVGAKVQVWAPDGREMQTGTTDSKGTFILSVCGKWSPICSTDPDSGVTTSSVPSRFVVSATGGTYKGEPFDGTLLLMRDQAADPTAPLTMNIPTTLSAWVFQDMAPQSGTVAPEDAVARVRQYLGAGDTYDIRMTSSDLFDPAVFVAEYPVANFDSGMQSLAERIVASPDATEWFGHADKIEYEIGGKVAVYAYKQMFSWMLGHEDDAFAQTVGSWGMTAMSFLSGPDYGPQLAQIQQSLVGIQRQLDAVQLQIADLERSMNQQFSDVKNAIEALGIANDTTSLRTDYNVNEQSLRLPRAVILGHLDSYNVLLSRQSAPDDELNDLASTIIATVPTALNQLRDAQMGIAGAERTSLIRLWHRLQAATFPGYPYNVNSDFFESINQQQDSVASLEVIGMTLLVEAKNYKEAKRQNPQNPAALTALIQSPYAKPTIDLYGARLADQAALVFAPRTDPGIMADLYNGRSFVKAAAAFTQPASGLNCSYVQLRWTERTITPAGAVLTSKSLNDPPTSGTQVDCNVVAFPTGTAAFNAQKPFGFNDWQISTMPVYVRSSSSPYKQLTGYGYDFGAAVRAAGGESQFLGTAAGMFAIVSPQLDFFFTLNKPNAGFAINGLGSPVQLTELWSRMGGHPSMFFSRPYKADPLAATCAPSSTGKIVCPAVYRY